MHGFVTTDNQKHSNVRYYIKRTQRKIIFLGDVPLHNAINTALAKKDARYARKRTKRKYRRRRNYEVLALYLI